MQAVIAVLIIALAAVLLACGAWVIYQAWRNEQE